MQKKTVTHSGIATFNTPFSLTITKYLQNFSTYKQKRLDVKNKYITLIVNSMIRNEKAKIKFQ